MPVIVVTALGTDPLAVRGLLTRLTKAVAEAIPCLAEGVWSSFVPAAAQHVGRRIATVGDQCPIVVIRGRARADDQVSAAMAAAAYACGAELGVPVEDVWVQWIDVIPGRTFAGGVVVA